MRIITKIALTDICRGDFYVKICLIFIKNQTNLRHHEVTLGWLVGKLPVVFGSMENPGWKVYVFRFLDFSIYLPRSGCQGCVVLFVTSTIGILR